MDARTVQTLLRCVQSDGNRFSMGVTLVHFVEEYKIGFKKGKSIYFSADDKERIRRIFESDGVNPETSPDAWKRVSRAEALSLGNNEKFAQQPVKQYRVAIKAIRPDLAIYFNGQSLFLPPRVHIAADYRQLNMMDQHDWIVIVENWECFNDIHVAADKLIFPGKNPLIMWRGDKDDIQADNMLAFVKSLTQPVAAFVDYDPAGLIIAKSFPRLSKIVVPGVDQLRNLMEKGIEDRYSAQIAMCQRVLDECNDPVISDLWKIIKAAGRALPQEHFVRGDSR